MRFAALRQTAARYTLWKCYNITSAGKCERAATINISANSHSSSLLPASKRTLEIGPLCYVGEVAVHRLESVLDQFAHHNNKIFLRSIAKATSSKFSTGRWA